MMSRAILIGVCALAACRSGDSAAPEIAETAESAPPPLEVVDEPVQPLTQVVVLDAARVALGERLFNERLLSRDGSLACATCHPLARGGTDGLEHSRTFDGKTAPLNTPTVFNVAFSFRYNWNGAYASLEEELDAPMLRAMGSDWASVLEKLRGVASYRSCFAAVYPDGLTIPNVRDALANFERSLYTPDCRFDRFLRGDAQVLTDEEKAGWALFKEYGCASCHQGENVGGNLFQRIGVMRDYFAERQTTARSKADLGRYLVTADEKDRHVFRVPSLRNVALTAPYFHDGSAATLEQAITAMARYQLGRPLRPEQVARIAAFLRTLTGEFHGQPLDRLQQSAPASTRAASAPAHERLTAAGEGGEERDRFAAALGALPALDGSLDEDVLKVRAGLLVYYDPLVRTLKRLHGEERVLEGVAAAPLPAEARDEVARRMAGFSEALQAKEQRVEQFKTESAVLRNSQRYFPVAATELAGRAGALGPAVEGLLHDVSLYDLHPGEELGARVEKRLAALDGEQAHLAPELAAELGGVLQHARTIVERKRRVEEAVRQIVHLPTQSRAEAAARAYQRHQREARAGAALRRRALYGAGGALAALAAVAGALLFRRSWRTLRRERARAEGLLREALPPSLLSRASQMDGQGEVAAERYPDATVLLAHVAGFSRLTVRLPPTEAVALLQRVFTALDGAAEKHGLERVKTAGESYLAAAGLVVPRPDHAEAAADTALAMQRAVAAIATPGGEPLKLRIAVASGEVVAGVMRARKLAYDLWGDTIDVASRIEQAGVPGEIQVSESVWRRLREHYLFEERGSVAARGHRETRTFRLVARKVETEEDGAGVATTGPR
jgi:cytochrome c peroxidase